MSLRRKIRYLFGLKPDQMSREELIDQCKKLIVRCERVEKLNSELIALEEANKRWIAQSRKFYNIQATEIGILRKKLKVKEAEIAQLAEQLPCKQQVGDSTSSLSTTK